MAPNVRKPSNWSLMNQVEDRTGNRGKWGAGDMVKSKEMRRERHQENDLPDYSSSDDEADITKYPDQQEVAKGDDSTASNYDGEDEMAYSGDEEPQWASGFAKRQTAAEDFEVQKESTLHRAAFETGMQVIKTKKVRSWEEIAQGEQNNTTSPWLAGNFREEVLKHRQPIKPLRPRRTLLTLQAPALSTTIAEDLEFERELNKGLDDAMVSDRQEEVSYGRSRKSRS
jgi:hypothetical protein